ncbi:hypothetical protein HZH66_000860 [Vespula vulgaris]|uniref:Uncharacterized protein n=1 Tax=Vespula vulgaris TaxID=7454 RepID=A0A834NL74_VESVU|nr:hypothetical protein HZH66_000860 [Vespula vulgaris]
MTQETVTNRLENIGDKITNTEEKNGREKVEQKSKRHEKQQIIEGPKSDPFWFLVASIDHSSSAVPS